MLGGFAVFQFWQERSLFYLSKMYSEDIHVGDDYHVLGKCIHVGILDFLLFEEGEEKKLMEQVCKKMKKKCSVSEIAGMLEEEEAIIQPLYDIASTFAPDYDIEKIMRVLEERRTQVSV